MRKISSLGYLLAFLIPFMVLASIQFSGFYFLIPAIFVFAIMPILDYTVGTDNSNINPQFQHKYLNKHYFKYITYVWVIVQTLVFAYICYFITVKQLSSIEWIGITISTMIINGGIGITVAHELGHKKNPTERFLAKFLLIQVGYGHFYIEHNRGHHINVSTPIDPSSAKKGQSLYAFFPQAIFGGLKSAWDLEKQRLTIKKKAIFSFHNEAIRLWLFSFLLFAGITLLSSIFIGHFHMAMVVFLFTSSLLSILILEGVNYIEHYGIERKLLADGKYEKVNPIHSWNTNHIISNYLLFQLQRHSDHHMTASKRYQMLNQYEYSPQLPNGYPGMILIALIPKLWFKLMDQKLNDWKKSNENYARS